MERKSFPSLFFIKIRIDQIILNIFRELSLLERISLSFLSCHCCQTGFSSAEYLTVSKQHAAHAQQRSRFEIGHLPDDVSLLLRPESFRGLLSCAN